MSYLFNFSSRRELYIGSDFEYARFVPAKSVIPVGSGASVLTAISEKTLLTSKDLSEVFARNSRVLLVNLHQQGQMACLVREDPLRKHRESFADAIANKAQFRSKRIYPSD